jgi:hypothetical protein
MDMCRCHSHVHLHNIGWTPTDEFAFYNRGDPAGESAIPTAECSSLRWTMPILILTSTLMLITIVFFGGNEILHTECSTTDRSMNSNGSITHLKAAVTIKETQQKPRKATIHEERVSSWGHT